MDTFFHQTQIVLFILGALLLYSIFSVKKEHFVAYNSFEAPAITKADAEQWSKLNDRFGTLLQVINGQTFSMSYQMDNLVQTFSDMLNSLGMGIFKVLSIGSSKPFTLIDVNVLDQTTHTPIHFDRVDFITNSLNPFLIDKIVTFPSMITARPKSVDELEPYRLFRIKNNLGLFYPYPTSFNEMTIDQNMINTFEKTLASKAKQDISPISSSATLYQTSIH